MCCLPSLPSLHVHGPDLACPSLSRFTEADLRLYPTIVRFDAAYATLFKCCRRRIADYPNLSAWLRDVYQLDVGAASPVQARYWL